MKKIAAIALILALLLSLAAFSTRASADPKATTAPTKEPTPTAEPTPEANEEPSPSPEGTNKNTATIVMGGGPSNEVTDTEEIRGGTNQNDAFLLPLDTKLYGTVRDGEIQWFAFNTDSTPQAEYAVTLVNKSVGTWDLYATIYDEYGTKIASGYAEEDGRAGTFKTTQLKENTTYYLAISVNSRHGDTENFMLRIRDLSAQSEAYATAGDITAARGISGAFDGEITPGSNQDDAAYIPVGAKLAGTISDGNILWFAFNTDDTENAEYKFTLVNESPGTWDLYATIYDEYGTKIASGYAEEDGKAGTFSTDQLKEDSTYYIALSVNSRHGDTENYTLLITPPEKPEANTATVTMEPLVFETPFELNSTQVMFVANEATFIDEAAAEEALKPVAEAILAHPEASILIAGTTATNGTQEGAVDLSNQRAEAVKALLVSAFDVPEEQLQTIGLGYEDDPFVRGVDRIPEGDVNGQLVESEAAKNRRVIVLDMNDPIAQELMGE